MKFRAAKYSRKELKQRKKYARDAWHRRFAWWPVAIPARNHDAIVVPRHWVWLEYYARISRDRDGRGPYEYRNYGGEPSISELAWE